MRSRGPDLREAGTRGVMRNEEFPVRPDRLVVSCVTGQTHGTHAIALGKFNHDALQTLFCLCRVGDVQFFLEFRGLVWRHKVRHFVRGNWLVSHNF